MSRIEDPAIDASVEALVDRIREERGSLLNLYRLLLHSPGLAEGWLRMGTAVGSELRLDDRTRELATCAVAAQVGAAYEWHHHVPTAREHGLTEAQLDALAQSHDQPFDERDRAVLGLVRRLGTDPAAAGVDLDRVAEHLDAREVLELTVLVGFYWMVSRVSIGLAVDRDGA